MQNLLEIKDAGFYYEEQKFLFRRLNFALAKGETLAILGLNGQGKILHDGSFKAQRGRGKNAG